MHACIVCVCVDVYTGKETVTLVDGGSYMDSAEVFAMIRGLVSILYLTTATFDSYSQFSLVVVTYT